jgi:hypothetical protein
MFGSQYYRGVFLIGPVKMAKKEKTGDEDRQQKALPGCVVERSSPNGWVERINEVAVLQSQMRSTMKP